MQESFHKGQKTKSVGKSTVASGAQPEFDQCICKCCQIKDVGVLMSRMQRIGPVFRNCRHQEQLSCAVHRRTVVNCDDIL